MSKALKKYDFGIVGLGTMGRNLLLNMGDHGITGAGYDKDAAKAGLLEKEDKHHNLKGFTDLKEFASSLKSPKEIMLLVPAGKIVDEVITELKPLLNKGDILIDGGNSHFTDTSRRAEYLKAMGFHFFGMGISGGEEGARKGPSMMPGGDKAAYKVMKPILESIAAKVDGASCVTYIGPGASGHFVKMVHNGIEYGLMQLIAETYEILSKGLKMNNDFILEVFTKWNKGRLQSFLLEITKDIFAYQVPGTHHLLLDDIKDDAKSKGTGKWTSQVSMDLQVPIPTIDTAVSMRDLSKYKHLREQVANLFNDDKLLLNADSNEFITTLEQAFYFTMIITYAQGMHLLSVASEEYKYDLKLAEIAEIWRGGCIIRSAFLDDIYNAYQKNTKLAHLLLDRHVQDLVAATVPDSRKVLSVTITAGIATPAYAASLNYFDALRCKKMPSNLIQAQRDYFGAHTYELTGKKGVFHTQWIKKDEDE